MRADPGVNRFAWNLRPGGNADEDLFPRQVSVLPGDYSFMTRQRGMFSFSGLTKPQVEALREEYAIYIVGSGRINVAGLTPSNVGRVAEAISKVVS